jgi:PIN domain nuclease of toxin-antitoxin system
MPIRLNKKMRNSTTFIYIHNRIIIQVSNLPVNFGDEFERIYVQMAQTGIL